MGGGGGGGIEPPRRGSSTMRDAQNVIDQAIGDSLRPRIRNVFISFHIEDEAQVNLLRMQSKDNEFGIQFRDYSVKEPFNDQWRARCRERIRQCSAMIVMIGIETAEREAVLWEIGEALRQEKKVIGVRKHRDRDDPIPYPLIDHGCPIIDWNLAKISKLLDDP